MKTVTASENGSTVEKLVVDQQNKFNDPDKDVADMKYLTNKYGNSVQLLYLKTSKDLREIVKKSGVWTDDAQESPTIYAYQESQQGGKMDNWAKYFGPEAARAGIELNDVNSDRGGFFVYKGVNKVYNAMDFGNALWGLEMMHLGFTLGEAKSAAHGHHFFFGRRRHGQGGLLDADADQQSIKDGLNKFSTGSTGGKW